ncbi:MAG: TonB-dependent receptor plug domain-containing protein [Candidatus Sericytochromatia bacterium]
MNYKIMNKNIKLLLSTIFSLFLISNINAYAEEDNLEEVLSEPIKPEVTVASKKELTLKKSPGIITLITEEEIRNSGARTLQEVLELIPGLNFNIDVQGVIGISIRGLWANEGKVLLNIDGQELNDSLWLTPIFGNHIQVGQIKRIEVLRGPGSSVYGRNAELAVINIITKTAEDLNGLYIKTSLGSLLEDPLNNYTKRDISVSYGQKIGDFSFVLHGIYGLGNLSDKVYTDFEGNSLTLKNNQKENPLYLNLGVNYKDFSARFIADIFRKTTIDLFDKVVTKDYGSVNMIHDSYLGELKYDLKLGDNFTITPKFNYRKYYPWVSNDEKSQKLRLTDDYSAAYFNKNSETYLGNITANYDLNENFNFKLGADYYYDLGIAEDKESADFGANKDQNRISYNNLSIFGQGLYKNELLTFTLGSRYENHSLYGSFFVPRAAIATTLGDFHAKALFNKAFRSPSIININYFNNKYSKFNQISTENTTDLELELGYDINENLTFSTNVFDTSIENPIIYFYDEEKKDGDSYDNFSRTGSKGLEFELKYLNKGFGYTNLTYSFYMPNDNKVDIYEVPNNKNFLLANPNHKVTFNSSINISENLSFNPSFIVYGNQFAYGEGKKDGDKIEAIIKEFPTSLMLNLNLLYKNFFLDGLNLSLSGYNLLNQKIYYLQPYNGSHAPIEKPSTEFAINLEYKLPLFNNKEYK